MWRNQVFQLFLICSLLSPGVGRANLVGNDTQNFNPTPDGLDFVTLQSSETLAPGILNTGFFVNSAKNSLPPTYDMTGKLVDPNDSVIFGDVSIAYGAFDNFDVALSLSYLLQQTTDQTQSGAQFGATGLNEIRLGGKYNLVKRSPLGVALIVSANLNQAKNNPFSGLHSGPTINLETAMDYQLGSFLLGANFGYRARSKGDAIPGAIYEPLSDLWIASAGLSYYVSKIDTKVIAEIVAAKPTQTVAFVSSNEVAAEALLGAKYDAAANMSLQAGVGTEASHGLFTPDWRVYAGVNFTFDVLHRPSVSTAPAPAPVTITVEAAAPVQYVYKGFQPQQIEDLKSKTFEQITSAHEFQLKTSVPDADFAGEKPPFEIVRLENFDFDFGSSAIRSEYNPMLKRLAAYLSSDPRTLKIRVEGHTDSLGSLERNRIRSRERAQAVQAFLEKEGVVSETPIDAIGFGADRPIADNSNFQGRKQNRRVEIRILRRLQPVKPSRSAP